MAADETALRFTASAPAAEMIAALQTFAEVPVESLQTLPGKALLACPDCGSVVLPIFAVVHRRKCGGDDGR